MAGPQNHFNAGNKFETVYAPDGTPVNTSRPNAVDLVRSAGYRWKSEDVGKANIEDDGPADPSADTVVIYSNDGEELQVKRANARELVASGQYKWYAENGSSAETKAAEAVVNAAKAVAKTEAAIDAAKEELVESLTDEAIRVSDEADLTKYLEGFSLDALKQIAEQRFGEKIHHRASKETAIAKIVELEEVAQTT